METVSTSDNASDFYEDDEPVDKIRRAFQRGRKGVTRKPATSLRPTWDEGTVTVKRLSLGGHGMTTFTFPAASSVNVEARS